MAFTLPTNCCTKGSIAAKIGKLILILAVTTLLAAVFQKYSGWGATERIQIKPDKLKEQSGVWVWNSRRAAYSKAEIERAQLLENGKAVFNKAQYKRQLERGPGWFRINDRTVRFSPVDGSNPTSNGKKYELETLVEVRDKVWWILAAAFVVGFALTRGNVDLSLEKFTNLWRRLPAWLVVSGFFVLFLAVRWWQLHDSNYNDGVMSLRGVPGSDASAWHEMSRALSEGRGFDSGFSYQRPFYSLFLSLFHFLFGAQIKVSLAVNCLLQAIAGTTVLILGRCLGFSLVAATVAGWMLLCPTQVALAQVVLTENMGAAFGALAVLMLWRLLLLRTFKAAVLAGLITAVGNLASGVFLLTVPLYPILLVAVAWWQRWGWKKTIICASGFCLAVCLLFLPWMIRQKVVHGAFTQALNSAELLYGGAHPEEKKLTAKLHLEAEKLGFTYSVPGPRYHYFTEKYVGLVKEDPVRYLKQLAAAFETSVQHTPRSNPVWQWLTRSLIILVALVQCLRHRFWLPALPAGLALLTFHHVDTLPGVESFGIAAAIVLLLARPKERLGWSVVITTTLSFLALAALSGNVSVDRFQATGDWLLLLLWCGGWAHLLVKTSQGLDRLWCKAFGNESKPKALLPSESTITWQGHGWRWSTKVAWLLLALCSCAILNSSVAYAWRKKHPPATMLVAEHHLNHLLQEVSTHHPDPRVAKLDNGILTAHLVCFDDFKTLIRKNEDLNSMTRCYERRPTTRWVVQAQQLQGRNPHTARLLLQIPGDINDFSNAQPLLAIGVMNPSIPGKFGAEMSLFEVLALCPTQPCPKDNSGSLTLEPQMKKLCWMDYQPEIEDSINRIKAAQVSP